MSRRVWLQENLVQLCGEKNLRIKQHGSPLKHSACIYSTVHTSLPVPPRDDARHPDCGSPAVSATYALFQKHLLTVLETDYTSVAIID
jgi:hypothetical protein